MSSIIVKEYRDCTKCQHFELEGIEAVCNHFGMVIKDPEPLCTAYLEIKGVQNGQK